MSRFNLIDEQWIPVRFLDGARGEMGIRDTLLRAREIAAIEDQSPLVVASLHRFLLAILYRALEGPTDVDQAKEIFKTGLPADKITAYLDTWHDRFWLFDEKYPFGQNPNIPVREIEPWTKLTVEFNATTNKVLFDHTNTKNPGARQPGECARWLLSTSTFSISGGRGYYPSPSPNAMMCLPMGGNLEQTLCYTLVPYPNRIAMGEDSALWEREPKDLPLETPKRMALGFADLYSWQPRMILLEEQALGEVIRARFIAGEGFDNPSKNSDPMQPYRIDRVLGKLPLPFRKDKGTWRYFDSLLPDSGDLAPLTVQNALRLAGRKAENLPQSMLVLGLKYEPPSANVEFWRMERFALPEALVGNRSVREEIRQLLDVAEESQKSLWSACSSFARDLLSRGAARDPTKKDISAFVDQMPAIPCYWSTLESHFHEILRDYTCDQDLDEIRRQWLLAVRNTLAKSWQQHRDSVAMGDAWTIRALVRAERPVARKLRELSAEIDKPEPNKEEP